MNLLALGLAIIAAVIFFVSYLSPTPPRKWANLGLGLLFFVAAFCVQLVWQAHQWVIH